MSSLLSYEKFVDDATDVFWGRLSEVASSGETINMGQWFQYYAFDVIGAITYGRRFGYLDECKDCGDTILALDRAMVYSTLVGVYAWAHPYLYRVLEKVPQSGAAGRSYVMDFASGILAERKASRAGQKDTTVMQKGRSNDTPQDFVDKMMDMQQQGKKRITDYHVLALSLSNIFAGSDTTAVSLSSILYHLIRTPQAMQALRAEIMQAAADGRLKDGRVPFSHTQQMPYLQACIKEGLRLHPATGLPMWRVVTDDGATISGQAFPSGTEIGLNSWIAHYNQDVWGHDAEEFRPERWIEATQDEERLKTMERFWIPVCPFNSILGLEIITNSEFSQFGMGSRTCLGKHISILEMSKLLPHVVLHFDFKLSYPERPWTTQNNWFVKPKDFAIQVKTI